MVRETNTHPEVVVKKPTKEVGETLKDFWEEPRTRRKFLKLAGGTAIAVGGGLLGWTFLRKPKEKPLSALVPGKSHLSPLPPGKLSQERTKVVPQEEAKEIKKFEGIKIELITDESLKTNEELLPIQEITYENPEEGPKIMDKLFRLVGAYTLKDRIRDPDFQDIPNENVDLLISTFTDKVNEGKDLSFWIYLKEDYSDEKSPSKAYKVDLTKGVNIMFVGEMTSLMKVNNWEDSKDFIIPFYWEENGLMKAPGGYRPEVSEDGVLTIKVCEWWFKKNEKGEYVDQIKKDGYYYSGDILKHSLVFLITQKTKVTPTSKYFPYPELDYILWPGSKIENDKLVEVGEKGVLKVLLE